MARTNQSYQSSLLALSHEKATSEQRSTNEDGFLLSIHSQKYGYLENPKKTIKNGQARTRESEEYKAEARKVKPQSNPVKEKPIMVNKSQQDPKYSTLVPQLSQKSKNVPSSNWALPGSNKPKS
ncbi:hypothetical protein Tco_1052482 [Tanacetum coccineum]